MCVGMGGAGGRRDVPALRLVLSPLRLPRGSGSGSPLGPDSSQRWPHGKLAGDERLGVCTRERRELSNLWEPEKVKVHAGQCCLLH